MSGRQDQLLNGASVSRIWGDDSQTELLAIFQYMYDAEEFAKAKVKDDDERKLTHGGYIVACAYTGRVKIFRPKSLALTSAKRDESSAPSAHKSE